MRQGSPVASESTQGSEADVEGQMSFKIFFSFEIIVDSWEVAKNV